MARAVPRETELIRICRAYFDDITRVSLRVRTNILRILVIGSSSRSLINFRGPLLRLIVQKGHDVIASAPDADLFIRERLREIGARYHDVPIRRASLNPVGDLVTLAHFILLVRRARPQVLLSYTIKPVIWGSIAARLCGVPKKFVMITGLGYAFIDSGSARQLLVQRVVCAMYRVALKDADGAFFQNPDDEAEFRRRGLLGRRTRVVQINGSGVDLTEFPPRTLPDEPVFLLMARLIADKGIREYCEAAFLLRSRYPQARFMLAGGFDTNPSAIRVNELRQWQVEGGIEYLGKLDDVRSALATCSVYVLPSYREGTPRTILEALATGRPIVTTDAPGCRETVRNGVNGYLVSPRNSPALADAMEKLIEDEPLRRRMAAESLSLAREKYDVRLVNQAIIEEMGL